MGLRKPSLQMGVGDWSTIGTEASLDLPPLPRCSSGLGINSIAFVTPDSSDQHVPVTLLSSVPPPATHAQSLPHADKLADVIPAASSSYGHLRREQQPALVAALGGGGSSKKLGEEGSQGVVEDFDLRALQQKLELLTLQRSISAVKCEMFLNSLEQHQQETSGRHRQQRERKHHHQQHHQPRHQRAHKAASSPLPCSHAAVHEGTSRSLLRRESWRERVVPCSLESSGANWECSIDNEWEAYYALTAQNPGAPTGKSSRAFLRRESWKDRVVPCSVESSGAIRESSIDKEPSGAKRQSCVDNEWEEYSMTAQAAQGGPSTRRSSLGVPPSASHRKARRASHDAGERSYSKSSRGRLYAQPASPENCSFEVFPEGIPYSHPKSMPSPQNLFGDYSSMQQYPGHRVQSPSAAKENAYGAAFSKSERQGNVYADFLAGGKVRESKHRVGSQCHEVSRSSHLSKQNWFTPAQHVPVALC